MAYFFSSVLVPRTFATRVSSQIKNGFGMKKWTKRPKEDGGSYRSDESQTKLNSNRDKQKGDSEREK